MATHVGWGRSSRTRSHRPRKGRVGVARNRRGVVVGVADVAGRDPRREERRGCSQSSRFAAVPTRTSGRWVLCRSYRRVQPTTALRRPHSPPAEKHCCARRLGGAGDNAVIITVAGVDPSSIRQSSMSGTVTRNECGPSHFEAISAYRVRAESPGASTAHTYAPVVYR